MRPILLHAWRCHHAKGPCSRKSSLPTGLQTFSTKMNYCKKIKAWFRRRTSCAEPNWICSTWSDTGATSDSDGAPCVEPKLRVREALSNLTLLQHQTKTAVPNWFKHHSFAVLHSSVRFCTWIERRLKRAKCISVFLENFSQLLALSKHARVPLDKKTLHGAAQSNHRGVRWKID